MFTVPDYSQRTKRLVLTERPTLLRDRKSSTRVKVGLHQACQTGSTAGPYVGDVTVHAHSLPEAAHIGECEHAS